MTVHSAHWGAFHPRVEDGRPVAADRDPHGLPDLRPR
jgi:hypothetical protein